MLCGARKRYGILLLLTTLLFTLAQGVTWAAPTVNVQILSINDLHGYIVPRDNQGGAANLAAYFQEREAANPNTLIVHAGDVIGASPVVSALLQDEPTIEVLQFLGVDVGVPGNHAFDEGVTELLRLQRGGVHPATGYFAGMGFPLIAANVVDRATRNPVLPPYVIMSVGGVPIGFIGVVSLETPGIVMPSGVASVEFTDPVAAINEWVKILQSKGVQTIVVLAHEGGTQNAATGAITGPIQAIAQQVDDAVDVIVSGHTHTVLNGKVDGKLIVQAGQYGANFTDVDLVIDKATGDVIDAHGEVVPVVVGAKTPDPVVAKLVAGYEAAVRPLQERVVGETATAITRTANAAGESVMGDLVADSQRRATGQQLAFMNPGGLRTDLDAGLLTWGELYSVQPFGNNLVTMTLTGDQVRRVLNQQWQKAGEEIRTRFLQISGFKYSWDDKRPFGDKVVDIWLEDGTPMAPNAVYTVVANIFIAQGGDGFGVFTEAKDQVIGMVDLDAFVAYVEYLAKPFTYQLAGRIIKLP